jgi:glycosyltransferase involved in cell wall biosynthesis
MDYSGAPIALLSMAKALNAEGFRVSVLTLSAGPLSSVFSNAGIEIVDPHAPLRLPDLVIANTILTVNLSNQFRARGVTVLNWIHESAWVCRNLGFVEGKTSSLDEVQYVIVPAQFMVKDLRSFFTNAVFRVLPNLVYAFDKEVECKGWVCVPGSWEKRKGQKELVRLIQEINSRLPLLFVGAEPQPIPDSLKARFTGKVTHDQALWLIKSSSALISPSLSEVQPLAVLEAIASGVPVLISDIPAHREIAQYLRDIPIFAPEDSTSFIAGLRILETQMKDKALLDARKRMVAEKFGYESYKLNLRRLIASVTTREDIHRNSNQVTLSIVTVLKHPYFGLSETLGSVIDLLDSYPDVEWIIKVKKEDGIATPSIRAHDRIKVVVESDSGIYHAMNVAVSYCRGVFLLFIGSGDLILSQNFGRCLQTLRNAKSCEPIYLYSTKMDGWSDSWCPDPSLMSKNMSCPHAGTFISRRTFIDIGKFSMTYRIAGDYELMSKILLKNGIDVWQSAIEVVFCAGRGISVENFFEAYLESVLVRMRVYKTEYSQAAKEVSAYLNGPFKSLSRSRSLP